MDNEYVLREAMSIVNGDEERASLEAMVDAVIESNKKVIADMLTASPGESKETVAIAFLVDRLSFLQVTMLSLLDHVEELEDELQDGGDEDV